MSLPLHILDTMLDTVIDVLPITAIILLFQVCVIRKALPNIRRLLTGFALVLIGLTLFLVGLEKALFPIGRLMAAQLTDIGFILKDSLSAPPTWSSYYWVYIFAFCIGASTTIAEPSLIAVAQKANHVSGGAIGIWGLRTAVALGVAIGIALGTWRIVVGLPIHYFIIPGYVFVVIQTYFAPKMIVPLAYDSGGVTTSTVTVPIVAALGLGLAETVPGRDPVLDGFGLIAFASLFPMITVMGYAQGSTWLASRQKGKPQHSRQP
ncbi:MAG: DUF1538 domain-containing protein [Gammaproteobacteria bacterium]|nr:DUF1538 domain-containing protein [Gammaproteobacteria bacterium]